MSKYNLLKEIIDVKNNLPKKQKHFCEFLIDHYREVSLDSVSKMAEKAGVGTTTVLRTIEKLGFNTFNDFKKEIHNVILDSQAPKWWKFNDDGKDSSDSKRIRNTWEKVNLLQEYSLNGDLENGITEAVDLMLEASAVNVFGLRTSRSAALYLENSINQFYPLCNQLSYEPHFIFDRIFHAKEDEVMVIFALSPYTEMSYEVAKYCAEKKLTLILITDTAENSVIPFADTVMMLSRTDDHYSLVPAISLVETLTVLLGHKLDIDTNEVLSEVGQVLVHKNITKT